MPYLYVIVRRDLPPAQITVQSIHAALESGRRFPPTREHPHIVLLGVADSDALRFAADQLQQVAISFAAYHEPDMADAMTAVATGPVFGRERQHFRKYQLLKG